MSQVTLELKFFGKNMNRIDYTKQHNLGRFNPESYFTDEYEYRGIVSGLSECGMWVEGENGDEFIEIDIVLRRDTNRLGYKRVMEISLSKQKGSYIVDMARIDSRFQGHGIAPKIYKSIIKKLGIILQAGEMQSPGGRSIWARMANMKGIELFALDSRGKYYDVDVDENELMSDDERLYDGRRKMRVYAMVA